MAAGHIRRHVRRWANPQRRENSDPGDEEVSPVHVVTAKRPNHDWIVDVTVIPTSSGFWTSWSPFSLPQQWPFCWWVGIVLDHISRCIVGICVFKTCPSSGALQSLSNRAIWKAGTKPKYLICDKGKQFWYESFKDWCERRGMDPCFGAVGKKGSIAVIERFIGSLKSECTDVIMVPFREEGFRRELALFSDWYNEYRPLSGLDGLTPAEAYRGDWPASELPRFELRAKWPRNAPCASPRASVAGNPGDTVQLEVRYQAGRRHLPIVMLNRAA